MCSLSAEDFSTLDVLWWSSKCNTYAFTHNSKIGKVRTMSLQMALFANKVRLPHSSALFVFSGSNVHKSVYFSPIGSPITARYGFGAFGNKKDFTIAQLIIGTENYRSRERCGWKVTISC